MSKSKQISILVDEVYLVEIDSWARLAGRSRNWAVGMIFSNWVGSSPGWKEEMLGIPQKKIAEVSVGGGGPPDLSRLGKAQEMDKSEGIKEFRPELVRVRETGRLLRPLKMPEWSPEFLKKIAEEEPGGLMACSPEILAAMLEGAKTDHAAALTLHQAGVKLDHEILVRWGLAGNYKPKTKETMDGAEGTEKKGKAGGVVRGDSEAVTKGDDGPEVAAVAIGKPGVDMDGLRDICAGKVSLEPAPAANRNYHGEWVNSMVPDPDEVDLCGFKSYNEIDGENYICGKEKHGPKVKHGDWIKI